MYQKTVYIASGAFFGSVVRMFADNGWIVTDVDRADFLCLTGGEDISPKLYGESPLSGTYFSEAHDLREIELINKFSGKPKLGICRGAQLLNVVVGKGSMFQDVNFHNKDHDAFNIYGTRFKFRVSSIHHQMMIPGETAKVLAVSHVSTRRHAFGQYVQSKNGTIGNDPECIWYPESLALCYQPHPEIGPKSCTDYFFETIEELYFPE